MINEINHREPRCYSSTNLIEQFAIFKSNVGWHSSSYERRQTDLE